ncbi:hypothetical protein ACTTZI_004168 [Vibrio vulnificus]
MRLYSRSSIETNPLYAPLMLDLNCLFSNLGCPSHIKEGFDEYSTKGSVKSDYWKQNEVGDWGGNEQLACEYANQMLQNVFAGLKLSGYGGVSCLHVTEQWGTFSKLALELLEDYHINRAFYILQSLKHNVIEFKSVSDKRLVA